MQGKVVACIDACSDSVFTDSYSPQCSGVCTVISIIFSGLKITFIHFDLCFSCSFHMYIWFKHF